MGTKQEVEVAFQVATGGKQLRDWLWQQKSNQQSLRTIAQALSQRTGIPVSHESVRKWLQEG